MVTIWAIQLKKNYCGSILNIYQHSEPNTKTTRQTPAAVAHDTAEMANFGGLISKHTGDGLTASIATHSISGTSYQISWGSNNRSYSLISWSL